MADTCKPFLGIDGRQDRQCRALYVHVSVCRQRCGYCDFPTWAGRDEPIPGVAEFYLPSTSRLSATEILHAFGAGADAVVVVACRSGADRYPTAPQRTAKRVEKVRQMLADIGMDPQRVRLVQQADGDWTATRQAMIEAVGQLAG